MVPVVHPMATPVVGAEDTEVGQGGEGFGWPGCLSQARETILRDGADGLVVERLVKADEPVPAAPCDSENLLAVAIPDGVAEGPQSGGGRATLPAVREGKRNQAAGQAIGLVRIPGH